MNELLYEIWYSSYRLSGKVKFMPKGTTLRSLFDSDKIHKDDAENILEQCMRNGISIVDINNDMYPELLRFIVRPPGILYMKGHIEKSRKCVAVVGSRDPSPYGLKCTSFFVRELADRGCAVISGMARGIDAKAHSTALECKGKTYAVLGSGLLRIYPAENKELSAVIENNGALISEYPPMTKPERWYFPERNRIISGISHATLVVEGKKNSGSLITAGYSIDQGREVFCIPGNIFSENSRGVNALINDGARLVNEPGEIIEYLSGLEY